MLLWRCIDGNSYQGCAPPERQEVVDGEPLQEYGYGSFEGADWGEGSSSTEFPKHTDWGEESSHAEIREPTDWDDEKSFQAEIPKPVTEEAEWSDGWK